MERFWLFVAAQSMAVIAHFLVVIEISSGDVNAVDGGQNRGEFVLESLARHGVIEIHHAFLPVAVIDEPDLAGLVVVEGINVAESVLVEAFVARRNGHFVQCVPVEGEVEQGGVAATVDNQIDTVLSNRVVDDAHHGVVEGDVRRVGGHRHLKQFVAPGFHPDGEVLAVDVFSLDGVIGRLKDHVGEA